MEAMKVILDENLAQNAERLGKIFRDELNRVKEKSNLVKLVRGKGLLNAIVINVPESSPLAWDICMKFAENGLLAKPTHGNKIRFAPPLVITEEQIHECISIIEKSLDFFALS